MKAAYTAPLAERLIAEWLADRVPVGDELILALAKAAHKRATR